MKLFLFDVDGTLIRGDGAGRRAMDAALHAVTGAMSATEGIRFDGATDHGIVRLALERVGHPVARTDEVLAAYLSALDVELTRAPFRALGGAAEVARALQGHGLVGLGTGNVEVAAHRKMAAVGMTGLFTFGGYGSDAEIRSELLAIGATRGAALCGRAREHCEVVVIGDTVRDIDAGKAIGAYVVAVATGGTTAETLREHGADEVLASLEDVEHAVARIARRGRAA